MSTNRTPAENLVHARAVAHFWRAHAPLIALSSGLLWFVWFALVGNTWPAWAAAAIPVLGGAAHIYPWIRK
jgi:hypothetical protein